MINSNENLREAICNDGKVKLWTHNGVDVFKSEKTIYPDLWNGYLQSGSANQNDVYENNFSEAIDCSGFTTLVWKGLFSNTSGYGTGTIALKVGTSQNIGDIYNTTFYRQIDVYEEESNIEVDVSAYDTIYLTINSHVKSSSSGAIYVTFESSKIVLK